MTKGIDFEKLNVIILLNHGIFTWGNDAKTSYERMIEVKSDILIPKPSILNPLTPHVQPKQKCETRSISTVHFLLPQMVNNAPDPQPSTVNPKLFAAPDGEQGRELSQV